MTVEPQTRGPLTVAERGKSLAASCRGNDMIVLGAWVIAILAVILVSLGLRNWHQRSESHELGLGFAGGDPYRPHQ